MTIKKLNETEKKELIENIELLKKDMIKNYYICIENKNIVMNETFNKDLFFNILKNTNNIIKMYNKNYDLNIKLIDIYNINFITL